MTDRLFCINCGTPIRDESPGGDPAQPTPCPQCGLVSHKQDGPVSGGVVLGRPAATRVTAYPEALLAIARGLIADEEFSVAVVVAHMACEISVERALSRAFAAKDTGFLGESAAELLPCYDLANDRVRSLYNAVTRKEVQEQSFWPAFRDSATRRNQAVHEGRILTKAEAEASLKAASDLVAFLR